MIRILLTSTALMAGIAAVALAQGGPTDSPGPGAAGRMAALAQMDTDGDGQLSLAEFSAARQARLAERFAAMDSDGDGLLSAAEMAQAREERRDDRRAGWRGAGHGSGCDRGDRAGWGHHGGERHARALTGATNPDRAAPLAPAE